MLTDMSRSSIAFDRDRDAFPLALARARASYYAASDVLLSSLKLATRTPSSLATAATRG